MNYAKRLHWVLLAAVLVALVPSAEVAQGQATPKNEKLTPEKLTAIWWQWTYGLPASNHPIFDETGADAANGQPYKDLFFLTGVLNISGSAERSITIPQGTALFFPILNVEWDNVLVTKHLGGLPQRALSIPELRAIAAGFQDGAKVSATLSDGKTTVDVPFARLQSPPFNYVLLKEDNLLQFFGIPISGVVVPAVSDGYWSYIPPLPAGVYTLEFAGADTGGFTLAIIYHITVK